jgi:hypothetical protein
MTLQRSQYTIKPITHEKDCKLPFLRSKRNTQNAAGSVLSLNYSQHTEKILQNLARRQHPATWITIFSGFSDSMDLWRKLEENSRK